MNSWISKAERTSTFRVLCHQQHIAATVVMGTLNKLDHSQCLFNHNFRSMEYFHMPKCSSWFACTLYCWLPVIFSPALRLSAFSVKLPNTYAHFYRETLAHKSIKADRAILTPGCTKICSSRVFVSTMLVTTFFTHRISRDLIFCQRKG